MPILRRLPDDQHVNLYAVKNSSGNITYVLANSVEIAREIALTKRHINAEQNGTVHMVD